MTCLSIDEKFPRNTKVAPLSDAAFRLHLHALAHCAEQETDGFVAAVLLDGLSKHRNKDRLVSELVTATGSRPDGSPLWKEVEGGWRIHDYLIWNESHADLEAKRRQARDRMKAARSPDVRANRKRTAGEQTGNLFGTSPEVREVSCARARPLSLISGSESSSESALDLLESLPDPDGDSHRARSKRRTAIREDWAPSEEGVAFAEARGWDAVRIAEEVIGFVNRHVANHTLSASWAASWRTWVHQGNRFDRQAAARGGRPGPARSTQPAATTQFKPAQVLR